MIKRQPDRYHPASLKRYGFFFAGLEPEYWWWDLVVKLARMDGKDGANEDCTARRAAFIKKTGALDQH